MNRIATATLLLLTLAACSDSTSPQESVPGSYVATRLVVTDAGTATDALAAGATLQLTLDEDGTVSGSIHVPASLADDETEQDNDLVGTWALNEAGTEVDIEFTNQEDFVFEDEPWTVAESALTFSWSGGDSDAVEVTLTKD
jgi:hypothetical protein